MIIAEGLPVPSDSFLSRFVRRRAGPALTEQAPDLTLPEPGDAYLAAASAHMEEQFFEPIAAAGVAMPGGMEDHSVAEDVFDTVPSAAPAVGGVVESATGEEIVGWAFDASNPDAHLAVTAFAGPTRIGSAVAGVLRQDLADAGVGRGDHGFTIRLSPGLPFELLPQVRVVAVSEGDPALLRTRPSAVIVQDGAGERPLFDEGQSPIFVLGPARSGTSAVALGLLAARGGMGFGEGHILALAPKLLEAVHDYYKANMTGEGEDTAIRQVEAAYFTREVRRMFVQMTRSLYPGGVWIDKTPSAAMVRAAPLLREMFPNARFIFMKRRILENVASRQRKFPHESFKNHYMDWVAVMQAWLAVRDQLAGLSIEVDQHDLAADPGGVSLAIGQAVGLSPEAALRFHNSLAMGRQKDSRNMPDLRSTQAAWSTGLQPLIEASAATMSAFGYGWGEDYFR